MVRCSSVDMKYGQVQQCGYEVWSGAAVRCVDMKYGQVRQC